MSDSSSSPMLKPVEKNSVIQQVVDEVRRFIIERRLKDGTRLPSEAAGSGRGCFRDGAASKRVDGVSLSRESGLTVLLPASSAVGRLADSF